jgi:hypothetical protein
VLNIAYFLTLERLLQCGRRHPDVTALNRRNDMDPKLTILFLLIGCVIGLSHLNEENLGRMRRQLVARSWGRLVRRRA